MSELYEGTDTVSNTIIDILIVHTFILLLFYTVLMVFNSDKVNEWINFNLHWQQVMQLCNYICSVTCCSR